MDAPNLISLLDRWQLPEPHALRQLDSGTNNLSYRVTMPERDVLLRVYRHGAQGERIAYEHALLYTLQGQRLSFAVPAPVPSASGATIISVAGSDRLAALFSWLPGEHPSMDPAPVRTCARALAELDSAMAALDLGVPSAGVGFLGDLYHIHPAVPDPLAMIETLPLSPAERARLLGIMETVIRHSAALYADGLPHALVHRDLDPSNLLMAHGRVTAIFDFEFARPDLRAFDLAISTMTFSTDAELRNAFIAAYTESLALTSEELEAIPMLMLIYRAMSLISREGRRMTGHASEGAVLARARGLLTEAGRQRVLG